MQSFHDAQKTIFETIRPPKSHLIPSKDAFGRVLAKDLSIARNYPDIRLSAIDGYAFCISNALQYQNIGNVGAGNLPDFSLAPGQCAAVMTGAPIPKGADCMVRVEQCEEKSGFVSTKTSLTPGDLINEIASEATAGKQLAKAGTLLSKSVYPALFYAGIPEILVHQLPKIGILATGDELCDVYKKPAKGQVFDTNYFILESFLNAINLKITTHLKVKDDEMAIQEALDNLAVSCDIIVSSGGVSMGKYDYIKKVFKEKNYRLLIQGTAIKPGRPLMLAEKKGRLFFGMPGYPAAFLTNCLLYLIPAIKKACGRSDYHHRFITATTATPQKSKKGRLYLNRVKLDLTENGWIAQNPGSQKTSHFLNFSEVNGLAFLTEDIGNLEPGAQIKCLHFDLELC